jgi:aldose sugar dehydrogenase
MRHALVVLLTASCAPSDPLCREVGVGFAERGAIEPSVDVVVDGLDTPWSIAFRSDGAFVLTERGGTLKLVRDGVVTTLATVPVTQQGEGGLLGVAVDPNNDDALFLYGSFGDENRVERWIKNGDEAVADAVVVEGIPAGARHDGGRLRFGPDGLLYISTGETGDPSLSRDANSLGGKLLRVEADGSVTQVVKGIRNSQGFDFLDDGRFVIADHGPSGELSRTGHDELNVASAGDDLGWPDRWSCEDDEVLVSPRVTWVSALPPGGIALVRGAEVPEWTGSILVAALGAQQMQRVTLHDDAQADIEVVLDGRGRLRDVVEAPDGSFFLTTSNCDGRGTCPPEGDVVLRVTR